MKLNERRTLEARRKADAAWTKDQQRDAAFLKERKRIQEENNEKTQRLKTLRLAKEAAERQQAAEAAANQPAKKSKSKKAAAVEPPKPLADPAG